MTPKENLTTTPRELNFYGEGKAHDIHKGFVIISLRNERADYEFAAGEHILAVCKDDGEKNPIVVLKRDIQKIRDYSIPVLGLDGFFSHEMAVKGMKPYPGYENTTKNSPMMTIPFIEESVFEAMTSEQQKTLTSESIDDLLKNRDFRHILFPTLAGWMTHYGFGAYEWIDFLSWHKLVTPDELEQMKSIEYQGTKLMDLLQPAKSMATILRLVPANEAGQDTYNAMILGKFK